MSQRTTLLICMLLLLGLMVSCAPAASAPAAPFAPLPGSGGVTGEISGRPQRWANEELFIYAAPLSGGEDSPGVYFLEPALHPHAVLDKSRFQLEAPPGAYVLVVGPSAEEALLLVDEQSQPLRVTIAETRVVDLGKVALSAP